MLTACEQCHSFAESDCHTAAEWFRRIYIEGAIEGRRSNYGKDYDIRLVQKQTATLKNYDNPFDPEEEPYTFQLFETAISMAEKSDIFRRDLWRELLGAKSTWIKELRSSQQLALRDKDGDLYLQGPGRGSHARKLRPINLQIPPRQI